MVECCYAEIHLIKVSIMLSVENKPIMLSVVMLNIAMLTVMAPFEYEVPVKGATTVAHWLNERKKMEIN